MNEKEVKNVFYKSKENVTENHLKKAINNKEKIIDKAKSNSLNRVFEDIKLMLSMIQDYRNGIYKEVAWGTIASIVVALLYLFSPIDLIPDFIPGVGLLDDLAMIAFVLKLIHRDFEKYKEFKKNKDMLNDNIVEDL